MSCELLITSGTRERERGGGEAVEREIKMMMAPQIVGVLLKKPGQQSHPRFPPLDPQETKIRGELRVLCTGVHKDMYVYI